ncbi:MAG: hypothetical protein R2729_31505 [Bryobacteraceae bacterium]
MRAALFLPVLAALCGAAEWDLQIEQLTRGPAHHFFGYIGHAKTIPWNASGRYILCLRTAFQDHMPKPGEAAGVVVIDTSDGNKVIPLDRTRAWNFQQGTMFYWNPLEPETQFFFNDRDPATNRVFAVLYDVRARKRVREFRYDDTPFANSGVAPVGGRFLGLNYGRMARLRPVTGYPGAFDWNSTTPAPDNDGVFIADTRTGSKRLLVSFAQLAAAIRPMRPDVDGRPLFINHTLWNRDAGRIYFYVRADFAAPRGERIDIPVSIRPDGSGLTVHARHIGGHPEWENGSRIVGIDGGRQILYDVDAKTIVGQIGTPEKIPEPEGDCAVSPDGKWFVSGYRQGSSNYYAVLNREDGGYARTRGFPHPGWTGGDLRLDAAPAWNRTSDRILFPAIAPDGTRQTFLMTIRRAR